MRPENDLPFSSEFKSSDEYVSELLRYASTSYFFQLFCGGIHILDFFISDPGIFELAIPQDWRPFLLSFQPPELLDFLIKDDLDALSRSSPSRQPPESLLQYVRDVRKFALRRTFASDEGSCKALPRPLAMGMSPKKVHEVTNFAGYVDRLAEHVASATGNQLTHLVDIGSGQNYLGRILASPLYNRHIVAVEEREKNIAGAKGLDVLSGLARSETPVRTKKAVVKALKADRPPVGNPDGFKHGVQDSAGSQSPGPPRDAKAANDFNITYATEEGRGAIEYVAGRVDSADLTSILSQLRREKDADFEAALRMMVISIHSCGNLSHHGIRSLIRNPSIHAIAIVGCCYNLLTEKLSPPAYKLPLSRPSLQPTRGGITKELETCDPQGFPLSEAVSGYNGTGIPLNSTARMLACQTPSNWDRNESGAFITRHFYRAVLQRIFLDKGVVSKFRHSDAQSGTGEETGDSSFNFTTNPIVLGSLRKQSYKSFIAYVRAAVEKLTADFGQYSQNIQDRMGSMTDEEILAYEETYRHRKKELSICWNLMTFSACIAESLIVTDRWLFLKEHPDIVRDCWVETVFDFRESPRNLAIVGIKR